MAITSVGLPLQPPLNEHPIAAGGQFTQAWAAFFENVAAELTALRSGSGTGTDAPSGDIGEFVTATVGAGDAVPLDDLTPTDIVSFDLEAGDWEIWGEVTFVPGVGTVTTEIDAWIGNRPAGTTEDWTGGHVALRAPFTTGASQTLATGRARLLSAGSQTVYLIAEVEASGMTAHGTLQARRVR